MKKILSILIVSLTICATAYGADVEAGTVAELYENPVGRSTIADKCELITIWYTGTAQNVRFGVSGNTVIDGSKSIVFYEDGQEVTDTRWNGAAYAHIAINKSTSDTVTLVVSDINSDSSGYWHAAIGRDATPDTCTQFILPADTKVVSRTEVAAKADASVVFEDTSYSKVMRCGLDPESNITYRLKGISQNVRGDGTSSEVGEAIYLKVWDGSDIVYRRLYDNDGYQSNNAGVGSSSTVSFCDYGAKGLCGTKGKGLVVTVQRATVTGTAEANASMSIIVGQWKE